MMYAPVRFVHLLLLASIQPLSFLYVQQEYPGFFPSLSGWQVLLIVIAALFVSLFYLLFEQRYFPQTAKGALASLGAMMGNVIPATVVGSGVSFFGAYSVSFRLAVTYMIYFGIMTFFFLDTRKREKWFHYTNNWYITLVLLFLSVSVISVIAFAPPFAEQLRSETSMLAVAACILGLGVDSYWSVKLLYGKNVFRYDTDGQREVRDKLLEKWALPTIILLFLSVAAGAVIISWDRL